MYTMSEYYRDYPLRTAQVLGKEFPYRYHQNPDSPETLVLLTGGVGFSDLFYMHFARFARDFSVITFDYHLQFSTIGDFCDGAAALLEQLGIRGWLVGQSLGGVIGQVLAQRHPEVVKGLIFSNTAPLSASMSPEARKYLLRMLGMQKKMRVLARVMPFGWYKALCRKMMMDFKTGDFNEEEMAVLNDVSDSVVRLMNRPYELHMIDLLLDTVHYEIMTPAHFEPFRGRILLLLSSDDSTFPAPVKQSLIDMMPDPEVYTRLTGGHLAMLVRLERYAGVVTEFIRRSRD